MNWEVIFREESLAMYGEGIVTTLWLLASSLAVGGVMALLFALAHNLMRTLALAPQLLGLGPTPSAATAGTV